MKIQELREYGRTKVVLRDFGRNVVRQAKRNLTTEDHNVSKDLWNSISYDYSARKQETDFFYNDYGVYLDKGVQGYKNSKKAPYSPFKYKKKFANIGAIQKWVKARRFQFRNPKGKFLSFDQTAFLIAGSIARDGTPSTFWFRDAYLKYLRPLIVDLPKAYARDTEEYIAKQLNEILNGNNSNVE